MPSGKQATLIVWFVGMSVLIGLTVWYGADHVGARHGQRRLGQRRWW